MKMSSTASVIGEIQVKTIMRYYSTPTRLTKLKRPDNTKCYEVWSNGTHTWLVWMHHFGRQCAIIHSSLWYTLPIIGQTDTDTDLTEYVYIWAKFSTAFLTTLNWTTQMSINNRMAKQTVTYCYNITLWYVAIKMTKLQLYEQHMD